MDNPARVFPLLPIPPACGAAFFCAYLALQRSPIVEAGYGWIVFAATVLILLLAVLGVAITLPVIIIYTIFIDPVFWGKTTTLRYGVTPKG